MYNVTDIIQHFFLDCKQKIKVKIKKNVRKVRKL